jgi:hypothetical protein
MSWLIEEESLDRFVSGDTGIRGALRSSFPVDRNLDNDDFVTEGSGVVTTPPEFVRLYATELLNASIRMDDDQDSIRSGVTILPSCSSSSVVSPYQLTHNTHIPNSNEFIPRSNEFFSVLDESAEALSMSPNSIDSSLLTEFSGCCMISSVVSSECSESCSDEQVEIEDMHRDDKEDSQFFSNVTYECGDSVAKQRPPISSLVENKKNETQWKLWYNRFETEKDWDDFQEKTEQLLEALDCPIEDRDEFIAHLINMEEKMFWDSSNEANDTVIVPSKISWLLELAALSASIAVAGVVIIRLLKGR